MVLDEENEALATEVLERARQKGVTVGTAESCTGGLVAATLTAIPGSSDVVRGGVVSYWAEVKKGVLGVPEDVIDTFGVVSEQCAQALAKGAAKALGCEYAVSTTGIAGPGGAEPGKPVGTVCFGLHAPQGERTLTTCRGDSRAEVRSLAVRMALQLLLDEL